MDDLGPAGWHLQAVLLMGRAESTGDYSVLGQAIALLERALAATPPTDPARPMYASHLGKARRDQYQQHGDRAALARATALHREALDATPPGAPERAERLFNLGNVIADRYEALGDVGSLPEAAGLLTEAAGTSAGKLRAMALSNLGGVLRDLYDCTAEHSHLSRAVEALSEAEALLAGTPLEATVHRSLLAARAKLYLHNPEPSDVDGAIAATELLSLVPGAGDEPELAETRVALAYAARFEKTGDLGDLRETITRFRLAVAALTPGHAFWPAAVGNLGNALRTLYDQTGDAGLLREAIDQQRAAAEASASSVHYPLLASHLGVALAAQAGHFGDTTALAESIVWHRTAIAAAEPDSADLPVFHLNLGDTIVRWYEHTGNSGVLAEAEAVVRAGVAIATVPAEAALLHGVLGLVLMQSLQDGETGVLSEAISSLRLAVGGIPAQHQHKPQALCNLGLALLLQYRRDGDAGQVTEAVRWLRECVAAARPGHSGRMSFGHNLAVALWEAGDADGALEAMNQALREETGPPLLRIRSLRICAEWAAGAGDIAEALSGYSAAVGLLDLVAWRGLSPADQERLIADSHGLAADAASCALRAGRPELAVELLEQGRGVLLGQALDAHQDTTGVPGELAAALQDVCDRIAGRGGPPAGRAGLAAERDEILSRIRALPGLAGFLQPPRFGDLAAAAADGPVVMVFAGRYAAAALTVTTTGVTTTPLDSLRAEEAGVWVSALLTVSRLPPSAGRQATVTNLLSWLWDTIVQPVLATVPGGRMWWCPAGLLAFLPLHAAGDGTESAFDRVVPSYTPTLRALIHARRTRATPPQGRPLIVAMPQTPGLPPLPGALREATTLISYLPEARLLLGPDATTDAVRDALGTAPVVHFACHGSQQLGAPGHGSLHLHDGPLTVREAARSRWPGELAFLSACESFVGGVGLADEGLTVAGALQLSGYRHVIGTMWTILDSIAPEVAAHVYSSVDRDGPATALHAAIQAVRAARPDEPLTWAPFVHLGP
ncbi:CHAT domain-containing protein [Longispora albida]|uniref:CHAT domain-containing protein n=1 Tax=Longispora albida TaxID=203523 RepID=UPI000360B89E|nr:CHAT domain-containing protein [Longispora albida]